jgi:hypothetical protein
VDTTSPRRQRRRVKIASPRRSQQATPPNQRRLLESLRGHQQESQ